MTPRQVVEQFGLDQCSTSVKSAWKNRDGTDRYTVDVTHLIQPNREHDDRRLGGEFKPFSGCYYETGESERYLEESGFDEFPAMAPRWRTTGEDVWGTDSPGMIALGDIKQLQTMERRGAQGLEKSINPPMGADADLKTTRLSIIAGDVSYINPVGGDRKRMYPLHETKIDLSQLEGKISQIEDRINEAYYVKLFLMMATLEDRGDRTATEIIQRKEEKILALGPMLENQNVDLFNPLFDRTFAIMTRRNLLPPPPRELEGQPLKVEYISVMHQAMQATGLEAIDRITGYVLNVVKQSGEPSLMDKLDFDQAVDEYADMTGAPPKIVVPDDVVQKIRAQRAKMQQQAHAAETAAKAAQAAQALSQTDTSTGGNALSDAMGAGAQQQQGDLVGAGY
jgi:hypothetical protein